MAQDRASYSIETSRKHYILSSRFYVEMQGTLTASFAECSGLGVNLKKMTYAEGGVNNQQRIFMGQAEFTDITLRKGMSDDLTFWYWVWQVLNQTNRARRNINIVAFNSLGETIKCITLIGSIPVSWKGPTFQADSNSVAIEELTLAYESLKIIVDSGAGAATLGVTRDSLGYFPGDDIISNAQSVYNYSPKK